MHMTAKEKNKKNQKNLLSETGIMEGRGTFKAKSYQVIRICNQQATNN